MEPVLELAKEQMEYGFTYCDVLKISDNEIQFISGKEDYDEGIRYLQEKYQIPLILLTMGKDGSCLLQRYESGSCRTRCEGNRDDRCMIDGVVAIGDDDFPAHRGSVKNAERPIFLFYKGDLSLLSAKSKNIAVIGLLNPTQEIETIERKLVSGLVENGAVIVSGLALGCDSIAHLQTYAWAGVPAPCPAAFLPGAAQADC